MIRYSEAHGASISAEVDWNVVRMISDLAFVREGFVSSRLTYGPRMLGLIEIVAWAELRRDVDVPFRRIAYLDHSFNKPDGLDPLPRIDEIHPHLRINEMPNPPFQSVTPEVRKRETAIWKQWRKDYRPAQNALGHFNPVNGIVHGCKYVAKQIKRVVARGDIYVSDSRLLLDVMASENEIVWRRHPNVNFVREAVVPQCNGRHSEPVRASFRDCEVVAFSRTTHDFCRVWYLDTRRLDGFGKGDAYCVDPDSITACQASTPPNRRIIADRRWELDSLKDHQVIWDNRYPPKVETIKQKAKRLIIGYKPSHILERVA